MAADGRRTGQDDPRAARLRAALRANLSRRKAQARARQDAAPEATDNTADADQPRGDEQAVKDSD